MTAARHKRTASSSARVTMPAPEELPALAAFLSGYLHEDFVAEYETPAGAIRAFSRDATAAERRRLAKDLKQYLATTAAWPWRDVRLGLTGLGGAWAPRSRQALSAFAADVDTALER